RCIGNNFRGGYVLNPIEIAGLGDVPVLAELASQVAPRGAKRQDGRARQEMIERFFLDRINAKSGRTPVGGENDLVVLPGAHKAQPALAFVQLAIARTNIALDAPIRQSMPIASWVPSNRLIHAASDLTFQSWTWLSAGGRARCRPVDNRDCPETGGRGQLLSCAARSAAASGCRTA